MRRLGGTLEGLVGRLPKELGVAMLVVLHVPSSGVSLLADILDRACTLPVRRAQDGMELERSQILVAPTDHHLLVQGTTVALSRGPLVRAGVLEGSSVTFVDVTAQHRLQEELQGSRVQLETAYEELQSAVEELETTNEELQSTNEELETINDELRQRSIELNEINNVLEAILTSLNSAVVVVDRDVRIQVWNRHARELWGLRPDEVEGEHLMNVDIGLPVERLHQPIRACLAGEPAQPMAMPAINRRGHAIDCLVRVTPLLGADDDVIGVIVLMDAHDGVTGPDGPRTEAAIPSEGPETRASSPSGEPDG